MEKKYKFEIITIIENTRFKSWVSFDGRAGKYLFSALRQKVNFRGSWQFLPSNWIDSRLLDEKEITEENLRQFHNEAIKSFSTIKNCYFP